jgi:ribosomal protein L37AE/L43A
MAEYTGRPKKEKPPASDDYKNHVCPRCGKKRRKHRDGKLWACDVSDEALATLREYSEVEGKYWRLKLARLWVRCREAMPEPMIRAKREIGHEGLTRIDPESRLPQDQRSIRPNRPEA